MKFQQQAQDPSRVAILLTTYNGAAYIKAQLDSLLAQEGVHLHIYAFDDCSSDTTVEILEDYARAHPGVFSIFRNNPNSGGTGLNVLQNLKHITGTHDYVALADQDDVWLPAKLRASIQTLTADGSGLYFSNLLAWDGADRILGTVSKTAQFRAFDHLFGGGSAGCTYVMTSDFFALVRNVIAAVDLTQTRRISHDWIIYFLARHNGYRVSASADALIKYRIHLESQYGGMSLGGLGALRRKLRLLNDGFLRQQVVNALLVAREGSEDRAILSAFHKGRLQRIAVLAKYRFSLVRQRSRFLGLVIAALFLY
jgi:rhamnosyltransferase